MNVTRPQASTAEVGQKADTSRCSKMASGAFSLLEKAYRLAESKNYRKKIVATSLGVLTLGLAAQAESDSTAVLVPEVPLAMQHTKAGQIAPAKWTGVLEDAAKQSTEAASSTNM